MCKQKPETEMSKSKPKMKTKKIYLLYLFLSIESNEPNKNVKYKRNHLQISSKREMKESKVQTKCYKMNVCEMRRD